MKYADPYQLSGCFRLALLCPKEFPTSETSMTKLNTSVSRKPIRTSGTALGGCVNPVPPDQALPQTEKQISLSTPETRVLFGVLFIPRS